MDTLTQYIAKSTIQLREANSCLSFVSLIWREQMTVIMFNNLNNTIMTSLTNIDLQGDDQVELEELIKDFLD